MKIAVTYKAGQIFQHFGHTEQFKIYDIEDGKIVSSGVIDTNGSGHGALAGLLAALGVEIEGDMLGLGVNLFSDKKTLTEEYGYDGLEEYLQKKSNYYLDNFYDYKDE